MRGDPGNPRHKTPPLDYVFGHSLLAGREAVIFQRQRPVRTSGRARTKGWVLRFERQTPPFIEPLMGWTSGDDPLA